MSQQKIQLDKEFKYQINILQEENSYLKAEMRDLLEKTKLLANMQETNKNQDIIIKDLNQKITESQNKIKELENSFVINARKHENDLNNRILEIQQKNEANLIVIFLYIYQ